MKLPKSNVQKSIISKKSTSYLITLLLPIFVCILIILCVVLYNFYFGVQSSKSVHLNALKNFSLSSETSIANSIKNCKNLEYDSEISSVLKTTGSFSSIDHETSSNSLKAFVAANNTIHSIAILNKSTQEVLSSDGLFTWNKYFSDTLQLENRGARYWNNFQIYSSSSYQVLPPTCSKYNNSEAVVIPVYIRFSDNQYKNQLLVMIDLNSTVETTIPFFDISDNSEVYILNKYDGNCFDIINNFERKSLSDNDIYINLTKGKTTFNTVNKSGNKSILFSYSFTDKLLGYTYYAIVPYKNIVLAQIGNILIMLFFVLITIILTLIIGKYITKRVFTPIRDLERALENYKHTPNGGTNIFEDISNTVNTLVNEFNNLENILPYTQKQYILDFLNGSAFSIDNTQNDKPTFKLPFKNENFEMIIIQIVPLQKLFDEFTQAEYERIIFGCSQLVQNTVSQFIENAYFLSQEKEAQYIIINTDKSDISDTVNQIKKNIADIFKYESDYIELYITNGNLYSGLDGLKKSYSEAISRLSAMPIVCPDIISTSSNMAKSRLLNDKDELNFLNMLLSNNTNKATEFVSDITEKFKNNKYMLSNAYKSILAVIFKAMYMKNIPVASNSQSELDTYIQLFNAQANVLYKKILLLINKFQNSTNLPDETLSREISRYIIDNYTDSTISLDSIASALNIEKITVSSLIKSSFGMSFHTYLENIRIETAKKMIISTNKNIQDILFEVGFTNKQTFIRSFKKITGCTPSQYRHGSKL